MTESEWLNSKDPQAMVTYLRDSDMLSDRKARLFACGAVIRVWHLLTDERSRRAVEVAERYADGLDDVKNLSAAAEAAAEATDGPFDDSPRGQAGAYFHGAMVAWWVVNDAETCDAGEVCNRAYGATVCDPDDPEVEEEAQAALLRDILGPIPFRPVPPLLPSVRAWNDGFILKLATAIYEERYLPEGALDNARLSVLADALEEAGCTNEELLQHFRQQGQAHWRGCWGIDLILGKA